MLIYDIDKLLNDDAVVILKGDLASGKTTLVKEFAKFRDIKDSVTSPTFSLQQVYDNKIFHYDLYNKGLDNFISLGMLEELEKDGVHFLEWADENLFNFLNNAGFDVFFIKINKLNNQREYEIYGA